jgi:hypothetical protein
LIFIVSPLSDPKNKLKATSKLVDHHPGWPVEPVEPVKKEKMSDLVF